MTLVCLVVRSWLCPPLVVALGRFAFSLRKVGRRTGFDRLAGINIVVSDRNIHWKPGNSGAEGNAGVRGHDRCKNCRVRHKRGVGETGPRCRAGCNRGARGNGTVCSAHIEIAGDVDGAAHSESRFVSGGDAQGSTGHTAARLDHGLAAAGGIAGDDCGGVGDLNYRVLADKSRFGSFHSQIRCSQMAAGVEHRIAFGVAAGRSQVDRARCRNDGVVPKIRMFGGGDRNRSCCDLRVGLDRSVAVGICSIGNDRDRTGHIDHVVLADPAGVYVANGR